MTNKTKALIAGTAIVGLLTGSAVRVFAGSADGGKPGMQLPGLEKMGCGGKDESKDKNSCKGKNDCKGKGGCKSGDNGCKGKNSCKGKGGCKAEMPKDEDKSKE